MFPTAIHGFTGEYRWLSNFWPSPMWIDGEYYLTAEHYYQSQKTDDSVLQARVRLCRTPGEAKRYGGRLEIRPDWAEHRDSIMFRAQCEKYASSIDLRDKLLATGDIYLEETNTWGDRYWGVYEGEGKNVLGFTIMKVRNLLEKIHGHDRRTTDCAA